MTPFNTPIIWMAEEIEVMSSVSVYVHMDDGDIPMLMRMDSGSVNVRLDGPTSPCIIASLASTRRLRDAINAFLATVEAVA